MEREWIISKPDLGCDGAYYSYTELVRCNDCKHRFNGEHHDNCCDVLMEKVKWTFEVTVEPDWFCADGERKTDG